MSDVTGGDWLLVLLKTDNKGTATVLCKGMEQDTLFPDKVMLKDILGFFWNLKPHHVRVKVWSVPRDVVANWMMGTLEEGAPITMATLNGEPKPVPLLPDTEPNMNMVTGSEVDSLFESLKAQSKKLSGKGEPPAPEDPPALEDPPASDPEPPLAVDIPEPPAPKSRRGRGKKSS